MVNRKTKKKRVVKKRQRKELLVRYLKLDNKSRKGEYAYVKEPLKAGRYYKVNKEIGKKDKVYKDIYQAGGIKGNQGVTKERVKKLRKSVKKLSKYPNIEDSLRSGYAQTTINNANKLTPYGYKVAYMDLLRNKDKKGDGHGIVRDKMLIDILTLPENVEKWKSRVLYKIELYDQNSEVLASFMNQNIKSLSDIKREMLGNIIMGQEFSSMYKDLSDKAKAYKYSMSSRANKKGRISNIKIVMVFKKS